MAIIRQTDKKTGITYVYESISTWNKELKQPRAKRRLIGKIDPVTGDVVPTRKKKKPEGLKVSEESANGTSPAPSVPLDEIRKRDDVISKQSSEIARLHKEKDDFVRALMQLAENYGKL